MIVEQLLDNNPSQEEKEIRIDKRRDYNDQTFDEMLFAKESILASTLGL